MLKEKQAWGNKLYVSALTAQWIGDKNVTNEECVQSEFGVNEHINSSSRVNRATI